MGRRQGAGDYSGGSTVVSSGFGFTKLEPDLGYKPDREFKRTRLAQLALERSERIKAKRRKKSKMKQVGKIVRRKKLIGRKV